MEDDGTEPLDVFQKAFLKAMVDQPISNDRYIATFHQLTMFSGKVIFWSKKNDRTAEAQWRVYTEDGRLRASLSYNGFLILDEPAESFSTCVNGKLLVF